MEKDVQERLEQEAKRAAKNAYSPYSKFRVGAAALSDRGFIYRGCNVENASYGLTMCAERSAIFNAVAHGETEITDMAVACIDGDSEDTETLMPCGACRQVMSEFMRSEAEISVVGAYVLKLQDLLPHPFHLDV